MAAKTRMWDIHTVGAAVLPAFTILMAQILNVLPWGIDGTAMPWLASGILFYWSLFRPQRVPFALCLVLGLVEDSLRGQPLGLYAMFYLLIRQLADSQRRLLMRRPFSVAWLAFSLVIATLMVIEVFMMQRFFTDVGFEYLTRFMITALFFPFVYTVIAWLHHYLRTGGEA